MGVSNPLSERIQSLVNYAGSYAWGPLLSLSRSTTLSLLQGIELGQLSIVDIDGTTTVCGQQKLGNSAGANTVYTVPKVELRVHKETFWVRLLLFADMVRHGTWTDSHLVHC